jgi:hypothetical protein
MTGSFDASGLLQQFEEMLNYYFAQFRHMEKVLYKISHTQPASATPGSTTKSKFQKNLAAPKKFTILNS